jgi:hypothetical protein
MAVCKKDAIEIFKKTNFLYDENLQKYATTCYAANGLSININKPFCDIFPLANFNNQCWEK